MHQDIIRIVDQVEILDPGTVVIAGHRYTHEKTLTGQEDSSWAGLLTPVANPETRLAALLYRYCYVRPIEAHGFGTDTLTNRKFEAFLTRSNPGCGTWEPGWHMEDSQSDSFLLLSRHGVRFRVRPEEVRASPAEPGTGKKTWWVRTPAEYRHLYPGYYVMIGDAEWSDQHARRVPMVRLYWHLTSHAAPRLLATAGRMLNERGIPFQVKVLKSPGAYLRADAGVLYLAKDDFSSDLGLWEGLYSEMSGGLREDVPLFTKRLAPGLGVAESPEGYLSFGEHRCRLIACALWAAHQRGCVDVEPLRQSVVDAFCAEGLDPRRPYLGVDSADIYQLDVDLAARASPSKTRSSHCQNYLVGDASRLPVAVKAGGSFLDAAVHIGHSLCACTYWDSQRKRCNWVGRSTPVTGWKGSRAATLGPFLYDGLSGVAVFLAELFAHTGDAAFRVTALAAIRCAQEQIRRSRESGGRAGMGFYDGITGVAFAAWWTRIRTGSEDPEACDDLLNLLAADWSTRCPQDPDDLISGRAGAIPTLLLLGQRPGCHACIDWATVLGREMCHSRPQAWERTTGRREMEGPEPALTGLSHGAAGIGLGLLELYARTNGSEFLTTARQEFSYEQELFDSAEGNWPDRRPRTEESVPNPAQRFQVTWCHGAPGIALSRLRASVLDSPYRDNYLEQAHTALETTRDRLSAVLSQHDFDISCCHGVSGLVEALWQGGLTLSQKKFQDAALEAAQDMIRAATKGDGWRSGVICGGPNPSLMLGSAGVGYQLLRLHDPRNVPSLLTVPVT